MLILGLGSNIGNRMQYLRQAVDVLRATKELNVIQLSPVYESDALLPEGAPSSWDQPYLNMAISCNTSLHAETLLQQLKAIESQVGRDAGGRWGPRVIDIDILAWGDAVINNTHLTIPHQGLPERPFALWPLADLAPKWVYPAPGIHYGKTASLLCAPWGSRFSKQAPFKTHQVNASIIKPVLMAAVNLTPDSFSDGGAWNTVDKAVAHINQCVQEGATVIDIGAESTRPLATLISAEEEWARLEPVLAAVATQGHTLSVDTRHATVARRALTYGVKIINDVSGCDDPDMRALVASSTVDIIVMHHLGLPADKTKLIALHENPVSVVYTWGQEKIKQLESMGIHRSRIIFDVGIGFGKNAEQSLLLLKNIHVFHHLGVRLCVGHSRKSFMNRITSVNCMERDLETAILSTILARNHVHYLRVHNVDVNRRALAVCDFLE